MYNANDFIKTKTPTILHLIKTILFYLCFLPFLFPLITATISAITGTQGLCFSPSGCATIYGFEAFRDILLFYTLLFTISFPLLPLCLLYIIYYLITRKRPSSRQKPAKPTRRS